MRLGHRRILIQLQTGAGKTRLSAEILKLATERGRKALFLADRRKLVEQAAREIESHGLRTGIIMAGIPQDPQAPIQVASVQTMMVRHAAGDRHAIPKVDLVFVDEAHKSLGEGYKRLVVEHLKNAYVIGLTATPIRTDGRGLGEIYDHLITGPTVTELTQQGYLVPMKYYAPTIPDMEYLETIMDKRKGDYKDQELGQYMENNRVLIGDVVQHYLRLTPGRQAVVFASSVKHSMYLAEAFNAAGITAAHIDGETPWVDRRDVYEGVKNRTIQVITNYGVLVEGWDEPQIDVCILARPTQSLSTYLQMAGRVLRPHPGKTHSTLIDHSGTVMKLGFVSDERDWSLNSKETITEREKRNKEEDPTEPRTFTCEACGTMFQAAKACPDCGAELPPKKSKALDVLDVILQEVSEQHAKEAYQKSFYARCLDYEKRMNVPRGWAQEAYLLKFKTEPPHNTAPQSYDKEISNYNKYMQIRKRFSKKVRRG
jgi:DNA repair protein RadD